MEMVRMIKAGTAPPSLSKYRTVLSPEDVARMSMWPSLQSNRDIKVEGERIRNVLVVARSDTY